MSPVISLDGSTNTVSNKARIAAAMLSDKLYTVGVPGPYAIAKEGDRKGGETLVVRQARRWRGGCFQTFEGFPVEWCDD